MTADRILFLGHDPWRITHALFGTPAATFLIQFAYHMWFALIWFSIIYMIMRPDLVTVRARYCVACPLCWAVVGFAGAVLLSSAGPCYYGQLLGDEHFAPLMAQLHQLDGALAKVVPGVVAALELQDMLWKSYRSNSARPWPASPSSSGSARSTSDGIMPSTA